MQPGFVLNRALGLPQQSAGWLFATISDPGINLLIKVKGQIVSAEDKQSQRIELSSARVLADKYELFEVVGHDAGGTIHKSMQTSNGRTVAVKLLKSELTKKEKSRFERLIGLTHPNIVSILDVGQDGGEHYLVLDYVKATTLDVYLSEKGKLSPAEFKDVFLNLSKGLAHAHSKGVVHGDLKPSNTLVIRNSLGQCTFKLAEFGTATEKSLQPTPSREVAEQMAYLSPEQAEGFAADARSDVYSVGCMMYESLTGYHPFKGETALKTVTNRLNNDPAPFTAGGLERIVLRALASSPARRYKSAAELHSDLAKFDGRAGVVPAPAANALQTAVTQDRRPIVWVAVSIFGLLLIGVVAVVSSDFDFVHFAPAAQPVVQPVAQSNADVRRAAEEYAEAGKYQKAIALFDLCAKDAIKDSPDQYVDFCQRIAVCYRHLHDYQHAATYYEQAMPVYEQLVSKGWKAPHLRQVIPAYADTLRRLHRDKDAVDLLNHWRGRTWKE